jgi:hypothetical protein
VIKPQQCAVPDLMSLRAETAEGGATDAASLHVADVVDDVVEGHDALGGSGRFEALHLALPSSHRLVRVFGPVVGAQTLLVLPREADQVQRCAVGSESVRDNDGRPRNPAASAVF